MGQVSLTLNGRTYRVGCGDGEERRLGALGVHVREKLETVVSDFGQVGEARLLLMTALLITDELYEARAERDMAASTAAAAALREMAERAKPEAKAASTPSISTAAPAASRPSQAATATPIVPEKKSEDPTAKAVNIEEPKPALSSLQAAMHRQAPASPGPDNARKAG